MKLFFKEHLMLIVVNLLQLVFLLSIIWLDGYKKESLLIYILLLGIVLLGLFLIIRYLQNRSYYKQLADIKTVKVLDDSIQLKGQSPLALQTERLLQQQYQLYMNKVYQFESHQKQHVLFMNQWVHQMKTPLSVANLYIKGRPDPIFADLQEQLDHLEKGLDMVLYMSRLESFELDFFLEQTDLLELVNEVLSNHRRLFIKNELYPYVHAETGFITITDRKWLSFIISQVLTNAVRYSKGSSQLEIRIYKQDYVYVLEIEDHGVGIVQQDLPRIFDAHFTGENGRLYSESTGMGLYMAKEVCNRLKHTIEVESTHGLGTTIRLTFAIPDGNLTSM